MVAEGISIKIFGQVGVGRGDRGLECGVVHVDGGEGPERVGAGELVFDVGGENVAGAGEQFLDALVGDVAGENAGHVALGEAGVGFEAVEKFVVALGVELAVLAGKHAEGPHVGDDFVFGGSGKVELFGDVQAGVALEGVLLELLGLEGTITRLKGYAQAGVADQALLVFG